MFHSYFSSRPPSSSSSPRTTSKRQHVEIIGGNCLPLPPLQPPHQHPRLPAELTTEILVIAAQLLHQAGEGHDVSLQNPSSSSSRRILRLASVDRNAYRAILARVILPSIDLRGAIQIKAFQVALESSAVGTADLAAQHTRRLCITIGDDRKTSPGSATADLTGGRSRVTGRASLYDHLFRLQDFDKATITPIRSILGTCRRLVALHLETAPSVLMTKGTIRLPFVTDERSATTLVESLQQVKCYLEELTCLLSPWGGAGLETLFVNLTKSPHPPPPSPRWSPSPPPSVHPWSRLTHLQIHGPAGFRLSLPTASAIGSLPVLTHLALVMPNIVRDAGMGGDINSPPAALQLLVLLADGLQRLVFVGHRLEGYLGWSNLYKAWLSALRLPLSEGDTEDEREKTTRTRPTLNVQLITAEMRPVEGGTEHAHDGGSGATTTPSEGTRDVHPPHPNHFTSWMIARGRSGTHWDWDRDLSLSARTRGEHVDLEYQVAWSVEQWQLPTVDGGGSMGIIPSLGGGGTATAAAAVEGQEEEERSGQMQIDEDDVPPPSATGSQPGNGAVVYGIDNLD